MPWSRRADGPEEIALVGAKKSVREKRKAAVATGIEAGIVITIVSESESEIETGIGIATGTAKESATATGKGTEIATTVGPGIRIVSATESALVAIALPRRPTANIPRAIIPAVSNAAATTILGLVTVSAPKTDLLEPMSPKRIRTPSNVKLATANDC